MHAHVLVNSHKKLVRNTVGLKKVWLYRHHLLYGVEMSVCVCGL